MQVYSQLTRDGVTALKANFKDQLRSAKKSPASHMKEPYITLKRDLLTL